MERKPPLTVETILAWADAHHARAGGWPTLRSGPVEGAPGETWAAIDTTLRQGRRGFPGGDSLARLLGREGRGGGPPRRGGDVLTRRPGEGLAAYLERLRAIPPGRLAARHEGELRRIVREVGRMLRPRRRPREGA